MDFRSMTRRELQVLCKKNKIPANLSNLEMASKLTELFQEKEKPSSRGWIKLQNDNKSGTESNMVLPREAKKVRFSPEDEMIEFTRSREKKRRSKRASALGDNSLSAENVDKAAWKYGKADCSVRVTKLGEKLSANDLLNGNKRGRNKVNENNDRDEEVVDSVGIERMSEEILDGPGRVTRSRGKKLVESLVMEKSRGEDNIISVGTRKSLRNRGVADEGKLYRDFSVMVKNNVKRQEKVTAEENLISRQPNKNSKIVDYSEVRRHDIKKHENDSSMCLRNIKKSLAVEGLEAEAKNNGAKVDVHGKIEADFPVDEPMKMELRRSSRRKVEISLNDESGKHNFTVANDKYPSKTSVLHSETSENVEKVIQPAGVRTRSREANLSQKAVSTNGKFLAEATRENTFKNKSLDIINVLGEDVEIQQKNQARKRIRGHITGKSFVKPNNDARPLTLSKRKTVGNEKTVSAGVLDNFADQSKLSNNLKEPNSLEDSSQKGWITIGESLCMEAQLSIPDAAEGSNDTNTKKLICDKRPASIRQHHRKDKETSTAVGASMKSVDVSESIYMAEDPASEISDSQTGFSQSQIGISASKLMDSVAVPLSLRVSEHEIVRETMSDDCNSKPVLQVFGQPETFDNEIIAADLEVTEEAKADDKLQLNSPVLDHCQMKDISSEENLENFEIINETNLLTGRLEASNNADMDQKMGEAGGFEPCGEGLINFTDSTSALEMNVSSSGNLRISHESVNMTDETNFLVTNDTHSESDESGESRKIQDLKLTSDENMEFGVSIPFDGERNARTNLQDSEMFYEYFINFTDSTSALEMKKPSSGKLRISHESDNMTQGANFLVTKDTHSESDEAGESRDIKDLKLTSDENMEFGVSIPFDGERSARTNSQDSEMCSEYFINDFDKDGIFNDPPVEVSASMSANPIGNERGRSAEVCQVGEGYRTSVRNHAHLGLAETKEGRCLKDYVRVTGENRLSASLQFDCQRGACITPQNRLSCSGECSIEEFGGQGTFHGSQDAASTVMPLNCTDSKFTTGSSSLQEVNWSRSETSKSEGSHATIFAKCEIIEAEAGVSNTIEGKEANRSGNETNGDQNSLTDQINKGEHKMFDQAFESFSEAKYDPERLNSPLAEPIATPNTQEAALSSVSETVGHTMPLFKIDSQAGVSNQLVDENANGAESKKEKVDFADSQTLDVPMSMGGATNQVNFENQEMDLNCLSRSPVERVAPSGPKEALTHGTDKTNMTSLTKSKNQEMEEVSEWEDHIPMDKSLSCPTTSKQEYHTGSYAGKEGYQLQFLFATPIKFVASCKVDEISVCEKNAESADFSFGECFGTTKENEVTKTNSDEKVEVSGNELENYLGLGNLMLANEKDIKIPEINDVEVENTCSYAVVSKTIYDANEESWTDNTGEKMRESNSLTKENVVDIENEEVNEDMGSKVAKIYSGSIFFEAKCDGNEEERTENTSECMKDSNSIPEKNEEDIGVERVNEAEMENNLSSTVLSEATLDYKEKHWIDNEGEHTKKSNSVTEDIEEDIRNEEVNEIESFDVENIISSAVFSEAKFDACEEQCTEKTCESIKESNSATEKHREENMVSLGQSLFDEEATENDSISSEENIISPSLKNLRAGKGSAEMLLDFNLVENHRYGDTDYVKYEGEITPSSGDLPGITDNDVKQGNDMEGSFEKNLNPKVANMGSFNGETDLEIHKDSPPCILLKASHENDKVTEKEDMEMASSKSCYIGYTLDSNMLSTLDGIQKTSEERALHHHSVHNMVTTAEHVSTFWGDKPDMLQSLATHLFVEESECSNTEITNVETSNFNMKDNQEVDGGGVPQQFSMSEFHPVEDLKTDNRTLLDSSAYECSHLANTIKECLESEYSVAVLNDSGANLHNNLDESQRFTDERVACFDDKNDKPSIGEESEEPDGSILFLEPDEATNETLGGRKELDIKDDRSAAKKNARTILIHGTPNKLFLADNMKENAPNTKRSQIGDYTTVRPMKRRALQDVIWK
ncbi:uncharacterized protein [Primulina huaijiensis]|uniref:uncharacterized protein isoform X2 n=1 Tax=Primulina huaijiensis TaxID=1492673 RepID=UPI003CC792D5